MISVAVSRLHDNIISRLEVLRILDKRLICITYISGEYDLNLSSILLSKYLYARRAQKMSDIHKSHLDVIVDLYDLLIITRHELLHDIDNALHTVERNEFLKARSLGLSVSPLSLEFLYVRAITKHYVAQINCSLSTVHLQDHYSRRGSAKDEDFQRPLRLH